MGFAPNAYDYMPKGSYAFGPDDQIIYLQPVPEEIKQRFEADVKRKLAEWNAKLQHLADQPEEQHFF